ncbi:hypothetical protein INR49_008311 [Caranx melampygus]|nr:hypothetical protein INR49_008311 [Caranx melampygus]
MYVYATLSTVQSPQNITHTDLQRKGGLRCWRFAGKTVSVCLDGVVPQAEPGLRTLLICLLLLGFNFILVEQVTSVRCHETPTLCILILLLFPHVVLVLIYLILLLAVLLVLTG